MKEDKLGQEPAFPFTFPENIPTELEVGMNKRFYAACAAMQGLLSNPNIIRPGAPELKDTPLEKQHADFSNVCLEYADSLLEQEKL